MKHSSPISASRLYVGMDVHKRTIALCVYDSDRGIVIDERELKHDLPKVRKYLERLQRRSREIHCCYEASSCGYGLHRAWGIRCEVIAPSSIPRRSGDRVKTDRRDAQKLATLHAAGLLTPVHVPDPDHEAVRSLLRCRADLVDTLVRLKQRIRAFLLVRGFRCTTSNPWTKAYYEWVCGVPVTEVDQITLHTYLNQLTIHEQEIRRLEQELAKQAEKEAYKGMVRVMMAFRGIRLVTALTLAFELGDLRRFSSASQLMAYLGLVPSEYSSGSRTQRGAITKTGNGQARKALISASWKYAAQPKCGKVLRARQEGISAEVIAIAWKAQNRLYRRFHKLSRVKSRCVATTAVARELAGFIWAALQVEQPSIETD